MRIFSTALALMALAVGTSTAMNITHAEFPMNGAGNVDAAPSTGGETPDPLDSLTLCGVWPPNEGRFLNDCTDLLDSLRRENRHLLDITATPGWCHSYDNGVCHVTLCSGLQEPYAFEASYALAVLGDIEKRCLRGEEVRGGMNWDCFNIKEGGACHSRSVSIGYHGPT